MEKRRPFNPLRLLVLLMLIIVVLVMVNVTLLGNTTSSNRNCSQNSDYKIIEKSGIELLQSRVIFKNIQKGDKGNVLIFSFKNFPHCGEIKVFLPENSKLNLGITERKPDKLSYRKRYRLLDYSESLDILQHSIGKTAEIEIALLIIDKNNPQTNCLDDYCTYLSRELSVNKIKNLAALSILESPQKSTKLSLLKHVNIFYVGPITSLTLD